MIDEGRIRDEAELAVFITELEKLTPEIQRARLSLAKEKLELDLMYYEQKGSDRSVERTGRCLMLIEERLRRIATIC